MGVHIDQFNVPFCTAFRPKYFNDQLCYSVDLNQIKMTNYIKEKLSFSLFIDFNKEREFSNTFQEKQDLKSYIFIESIGN